MNILWRKNNQNYIRINLRNLAKKQEEGVCDFFSECFSNVGCNQVIRNCDFTCKKRRRRTQHSDCIGIHPFGSRFVSHQPFYCVLLSFFFRLLLLLSLADKRFPLPFFRVMHFCRNRCFFAALKLCVCMWSGNILQQQNKSHTYSTGDFTSKEKRTFQQKRRNWQWKATSSTETEAKQKSSKIGSNEINNLNLCEDKTFELMMNWIVWFIF